MPKQLLTDREVSERYGISRWAVNELRRRGEIPYVKLGGLRRFYFDADKIEAWLDSLQEPERNRELKVIGR